VVYSQAPILPLTLNYTAIDGTILSKENRDSLFWYGDMKFFPHILYFLSHRKIELEITVHPAIRDVIGKTDIDLANMSQAIVAEKFKIIG
jgi:hypothetical protein